MATKDIKLTSKPKKAQSTFGEFSRLAKRSGSRASASYLRLIIAFPIRPLVSNEDLDEAIHVLDRLLSRKEPLDEQEQGYLDSLGHEIRLYEDAHIPMPDVSGAALVRHLIDARNATLSEVALQTGIAVSTISSILAGKRQLNLKHIEKLAHYFGVGPGAFVS